MKTNRKITDSELEILQILWEKGPSSVRTVHEALGNTKQTGYTTSLKLMQIMFEKGLLTRDESAKTHIYAAAISEVNGQKQAVDKIIDSMFKGSSTNLVMHALGNYNPSDKEINEIKAYLEGLRQKEN
ncbi:BlaI/MecI/CopY family transcriptional regulator [Arachidicoccus terrestris]|uniref:BlaI/MecI/CopY family transcriptional regulator n=1 Tax=Arachidicoccus terrestris TaxID=2875539 RepID=UPI001CC4B456|nr:BlaI/MecI/CopY family transcriptional regulator [Arachidicoccus terrestris]UAY57151.1 BlaI/MecI/CopY family transcriptional regulator [Arachidicoccus terrestris]